MQRVARPALRDLCAVAATLSMLYIEREAEWGRDICTGRIHALICCTQVAEAAEEAATSVALVILFSSSILV